MSEIKIGGSELHKDTLDYIEFVRQNCSSLGGNDSEFERLDLI